VIGYFKMIINGNIDLSACENLKTIKEITKINGFLNLAGCVNLETLGDLEEIEGDLILINCFSLKSLGNLKQVKKVIKIYKSGFITKRNMKDFKKFNFENG